MTTFDLENSAPVAGDELRDAAANLLSLRYGRVKREKRVNGKKVDIFFERRDFGKKTRIYLEAKEYSRRLRREEVVHIWADYSGIIDRNKPSSLLLITKDGLSTDAQSYVDDEIADMRHQTIWELENESLGLYDYIRSLEEEFEAEGLSTYYIDARARKVGYEVGGKRMRSEQSEVMFDRLLAWLKEGDGGPIAILGGYGAGKSSLARKLISHQAKQALKDPLERQPIIIRLGSLARYSSIEGLLGGMFTHDFPIDSFNVRHFQSMNKKGRLLVVLDGFDEMKHSMTWGDFRAQIEDLNKLIDGKSKIVLLGRPSAFISDEEHVHVLRGLKRHGEGWRKLPGWPEFTEYELDAFTSDERREFVSRYLNHRREALPEHIQDKQAWITARAQEVNDVADLAVSLFEKPVHARILVDLALDPRVNLAEIAERVSRWSLFSAFFGALSEREVAKEARRPISEEHRLSFLRETAFWLWTKQGGSTSFSADDLPEEIIEELPAGDSPDTDALKREYLTGSSLEKKSGGLYYFGHRSFAEFLVAWRMVLSAPSGLDYGTYSSLFKDGVAEFLDEAPENLLGKWIDNFASALGTIHFEFILFLAEKAGGFQQLIDRVGSSGLITVLLPLMKDRSLYDARLPAEILRRMRVVGNDELFILLSLYEYSIVHQQTSMLRHATSIAAVLMDRVFKHAEVGQDTGQAGVSEIAHLPRILASNVMPGISDQSGDRLLLFRGAKLQSAKSDSARTTAVELVRQPPASVFLLNQDLYLPWMSVLAEMEERSRERATNYFRRHQNWRGVFTKSVVGRDRARKTTNVER